MWHVSSMLNHTRLHQLHTIVDMLYHAYKDETLTEVEYLKSVKPIDIAIGNLEMAILQDTLASQVSFLPHTQKPKC